MPDGMSLPGWPLVMVQAMACRYLSYTAAQFQAYVEAGLMPPGRNRGDGVKVWHREEIDIFSRRLWQLEDATTDGQAKARNSALQRLAGYVPPGVAARRARQQA